jgi:hypothetical protein
VPNRYDPFARPGFYLGGSGVGVLVLGEIGPRSFLTDGAGFSIFAGFRTGRVFALELAWQPTFHNDRYDIYGRPVSAIGLDAFTLDGKIYLAYRRVQPYFMFGGGAYVLGDYFSAFAAGPGYQLGGGIDFWPSSWFTIGLKVQYRGVALLDYDPSQDNTYISMVTGAIDLTGHF